MCHVYSRSPFDATYLKKVSFGYCYLSQVSQKLTLSKAKKLAYSTSRKIGFNNLIVVQLAIQAILYASQAKLPGPYSFVSYSYEKFTF